MTLSMIVATSRNGVIGQDNSLPWHLPEDLQFFKAITMGKPIVMGRKTFESIGRPLPGRTNIVITRRQDWQIAGVSAVSGVDAAVELAQQACAESGVDEAMVIGGSEIYRQLLPRANRLYVTEVDIDIDGDAQFPAVDSKQWREVSRTQGSPQASIGHSFVVYERIVE